MDTRTDFYLDIPRADRLSRGLIFIKWLLILPHALILWAYGILASILGFIGFFAILFTGSYPADLWNMVYRFLRWQLRVNIYTSLLRDEYPPFGEEPYPMQFNVVRPERQSRLILFVRWLAVIPLGFWLMVIAIVAAFALIIAWFTILFTGTIPEGIRSFIVGFIRYSTKVTVYSSMLTDTFPGFSLD